MDSRHVSPVVFGISFVLGMMVLAGGIVRFKAADHSISVTGSAQRLIVADRAVWRVTLSRTTGLGDVTQGSQALADDRKKLSQYLHAKGVSNSGVTIKPVSIDTLMNYNINQPSGYTFRQEVIVASDDVHALTAVAQEASSLLVQGALVSTTALEYYYSRLPELRVEMLAQATEDARVRAERIAESAGAALGSLQTASMGVIQLSAAHSVEVSDYGMYDTTSIEKQITAVVRASFGVR